MLLTLMIEIIIVGRAAFNDDYPVTWSNKPGWAHTDNYEGGMGLATLLVTRHTITDYSDMDVYGESRVNLSHNSNE